ncbi:hypothetical protein ACFXKW_04450, partial [Streptomyces sp. NPDC059193]
DRDGAPRARPAPPRRLRQPWSRVRRQAAPASGPEVVEAAPAADAAHDAGSYLPAVATGALVLLIGAAAVFAARRRRRTE